LKNKFPKVLNDLILILLTAQIASVSFSIALSSICFGIWVGLWLIQIIVSKKLTYDTKTFDQLKLINLFILLYILFEIFSRFFALYPEGAFINLKRLLLFLIFYVSVIKIVNIKTLERIMLVIVCSISAVAIYELIRYGLKFNEMISQMPFSEIRINYFNYPLTSGEIKMMVFLSVFPLLFIKEKFILEKKYLIILLVPVFISMILTQSRNVYVALALCFIVYGIMMNRKFLLAMIIIAAIGWFILPTEYTERMRSIVDLNHLSNKSRLSMWKVGWEMFRDHPFTGIADSHILEIYKTYKVPGEASEGVHLHSNPMMILATTGIFGFISFCSFFILMFLKQIKFYFNETSPADKALLLGSILVMISFQVSGIFEWSFGDHEVMTVFFFLIAVPFVVNKLKVTSFENKLLPQRYKDSKKRFL